MQHCGTAVPGASTSPASCGNIFHTLNHPLNLGEHVGLCDSSFDSRGHQRLDAHLHAKLMRGNMRGSHHSSGTLALIIMYKNIGF